MTNVFIFHGNSGYPEENWFPWLKDKLEKKGCKVFVPQFPTPKNQTLEAWFAVFEKYRQFYTPDSILVGHSLGGAFALRVLERFDVPIKAAFLVAAPVGIKPLKNYETDLPFVEKPFQWDTIKTRADLFQVFHCDNDPLVSISNGEAIAKNLHVSLTIVPGAGHFNTAAGYTRFDQLLESMKKELRKMIL